MASDVFPFDQRVPGFENLNLGLTTRVLAKKLERYSFSTDYSQQQERRSSSQGSNNSRRSSGRGSASSENTLKFLVGTAIPNSIIKADLKVDDIPIKKQEQIKKERDEYVAKVLSRLQPKENMYDSIYDESIDREALNKIKKELQKRSLTIKGKNDNEDIHLSSYKTTTSKTDPWQEIKEKRRISRRTSILAPLGGGRRSTYEDIRKAIQNSKLIQHLIDADNIEQQKIKQLQTGRSLLSTEFSFSTATNKPKESLSKVVIEKRRSKKNFLKRKHSHKHDKTFHLSSKILLKNVESSKESSKMDIPSKMSVLKKEDIQAQTSFVIDFLGMKGHTKPNDKALQFH